MKKKIFLLLLIFGITISLFSNIVVNNPGPYYPGDTIGFNKTCHELFDSVNTYWNWGDGTPNTTHIDDNDYGWQYHTYTKAGTYTVTYYHGNPIQPAPPIDCSPQTERFTITIVDNRYITKSPENPSAGQQIIFTAYNFLTPDNIRWDMGDGTLKMGNRNFSHIYSKTGTYTVRAYDENGNTGKTPIILIVKVSENRYITVSPSTPYAGQLLTFTAVNFITPDSIRWDMGDGTILNINSSLVKGGVKKLSGSTIQYTYINPGNYTVRAYDENGTQSIPVSLSLTILKPNRQIEYYPESNIRVDQPVHFQVTGFLTSIIDWNMGDGTITQGGGLTIVHRYQVAGNKIITAKDSTINHTPVQKQILILPENRSIMVSAPEIRFGDPVQITALNFRGRLILWDFGDGIHESAGHSVSHMYEKTGTYIIKARDENGESLKEFTTTVTVRGVSDEVNLEVAEIRFNNGKYYKVVPKNSKEIKAVLRMKMRGTGSISGYWIVDGNPFEFFNGIAVQGELKEILTSAIPGLPTLDPGIHTVSVKLTKPSEVPVTFPVLKYYVLPTEKFMETISPKDGFVVKEKEIPVFRWKETKHASKYIIGFSNYMYPLLINDKDVSWIDVGSKLFYKPSKAVWNKINRNKWTYWKIRAFDTNKQFIAESGIQDIKVVIAKAEISLSNITDLDGNKVKVINGIVSSDEQNLLVDGKITYKGDSKFILLRVYSDKKLINQLLFRDVKKDEERSFKTSIPNIGENTKIRFEVLKTSSPSVIIGIKGLILRENKKK